MDSKAALYPWSAGQAKPGFFLSSIFKLATGDNSNCMHVNVVALVAAIIKPKDK